MNDIKIRQEKLLDGRTRTVSGNGDAEVKKIYFLDEASNPIENISIGDKVNLHVFVKVNKNLPKLVCGFTIKDSLGQDIYGTNTAYLNSQLSEIKKGDIYEFVYSFNLNIGPGNYSVSTALHGEATHNENNYEWKDLALVFEAINEKCNFFVGSAFLDANINIKKVRQL